MIRLSKMSGRVYGVRDIDISEPDERENIYELVGQGTPVLLLDDDIFEDDEILAEYDIDADEVLFADDED